MLQVERRLARVGDPLLPCVLGVQHVDVAQARAPRPSRRHRRRRHCAPRLLARRSRGLAEQSEPRTVSAAFARHCGGESAPLVLAHRRDLEISGYLRGDGTLTVKCAITVLREQRPGVDVPASLPVPAPRGAPAERDGIRHHVRCLRRNVCRAAHKVVLAARSPLFMAEFFGDASDKKCARRLEVHGMEAAEFKAMLHFIYTDTTTELDRHDGEESVALTCGLLAAADRTAATILNLAELNNCPRLKASTFCQYDACMAQTYSPLQAPITKVPI
ncbi:BTB/POZ and MATH domain-containing protein 1-like [Triticum aestivum]|uniref:BTB/POZ and MATH domain-containing protein 1-like n=1 Tax=Triticum aestivum TaxID=4565 RepID=UPI001D00D809|nr:BTB/POZ and MATH domain-containing protein 1-like [Triticum aestivum]